VKLQRTLDRVQQANPEKLAGIFGDVAWGNKERLPEPALQSLIDTFDRLTLNPQAVPHDMLGAAYEYLLKQFADESGRKAGEFFTPRAVVLLLVKILDPQPEETIYDPACGSGGMAALDGSLDDLIARYNEIRRTMPSGPPRTAEMNKVFGQMISRLTGVESFDVHGHLRNPDRGARLAAYAYLHANRATEHLSDLVDALVKEDKPYGEYRAALAAERLVEADQGALNPRLCQQLTDRLRELSEGTDRAGVLRRILGYCQR
jgi:hypothetical protein